MASQPHVSADPFEPPTRVRYGVVGFMASLAFLLYLDRVCIAQAKLVIQKDLELSNTQMGWVFGAFLVAYALFEVPTGHWADRFGSRGVLTRIVLCWSAFTVLTGAATGLAMLMVVRFLFGAGEAGAYPNAARVLSRWIPLSKRGSAQSLVITAGQLGFAAAPVFTQLLINAIGWRLTFVVYGLIGIVWAAAFRAWYRDDPMQDSRVNDSERRLIAAGTLPGTHLAHDKIPWSHVLTSPNVWLMSVGQTCSAFAAYLYVNWYPTYLVEGRGLSANEAGWLSSFVFGGGAIGCLAGGVITDWLVRRTGSPRWTYSLFAWTALSVAAVALTASIHIDSPLAASACAALASMVALSNQATFWNVTTRISGRHVAAVFGLINSMGVPGAFASSLLPGHFSDWRHAQGFTGREQWDPVFYIYSGVLLFGAMCWLFVDCRRTAVGEEE